MKAGGTRQGLLRDRLQRAAAAPAFAALFMVLFAAAICLPFTRSPLPSLPAAWVALFAAWAVAIAVLFAASRGLGRPDGRGRGGTGDV